MGGLEFNSVVLTWRTIWDTLEQQCKLTITCIYSYYIPLWLRSKQAVDFNLPWCLSPYRNCTKMTRRCFHACILVFCNKGFVSNEVHLIEKSSHDFAWSERAATLLGSRTTQSKMHQRGKKNIDKSLLINMWLIVCKIWY